MDDDDVLLVLLIARSRRKAKKAKKRTRTIWVKNWLKNREEKSIYTNLLAELRVDDRENFRRYIRMDTETFENLVSRVRPYLTKQTTNMRQPIPVEEKLAVFLRFIATGESFASLQYQFRISRSTISLFINEVAEAVYNTLKDEYLKCHQHLASGKKSQMVCGISGTFQIVLAL